METIMKADIFFFVTTICVVFVSVFLIILLARLSMLMKSVRDLVEKVKDKALDVGEGMEEILERVEDSFLFNLIFPKSRKPRARKTRKKDNS